MSRLIFIVFFLFTLPAFAQNDGSPIITNYLNKNFNTSNWDVIQDSRGIIYIANYDGILEYDGITWKLIKTNTAPISLALNSKNQIFVGAAHGFGILHPDSTGSLFYNALSDSLPKDINVPSIFHVEADKDYTYFFSQAKIFVWDGVAISIIDNNSFISNLLKYNENVYVFNSNKQLFQLNGISLIEVGLMPIQFKKVFLLDSINNNLIVASRSNGLISMNKNNYSNPSPILDSFLISSAVFTTEKLALDNYHYIISTLDKGLGIINNENEISNVLNKKNGLPTDVVKGIFLDKTKNLWVALQEGLSHIELNSPFTIYNENAGVSGVPLDILRVDENIYLATTEGLFQKKGFNFQKIEAVNGRIWALSEFNKTSDKLIFSSLPNGLFELAGNNITKINNLNASVIHQLKEYKNQWIIGHNNGIDLLFYNNGRYTTSSILESSGETFFKILEDGKGNIWASSKFNGVYKISGDFSNPKVHLYKTDSGLPDINEISFANIHNQIFLGTTKGLYSFNYDLLKFEPHSLSEFNIKYIEPVFGKTNSFYIVTKDSYNKEHLHLIEFSSARNFTLHSTPFKRLQDIQYFDLHSTSDSILWIGTSEGLYRYNAILKKDYYLPFQTLVRSVHIGDSVIFNGAYYENIDSIKFSKILSSQPQSWIPRIPFKDNDLKFQFSSSFYERPEKNMFSYYLKGEDDKWSSWTYETKKEFNNLSAGEYTFLVKSKNIYDKEGQIATYSFIISPPWYQTVWAYILFIFTGAFFIWLMMILYTMRIRQQRRKLKLLVADRTYEVLAQKKAIEEQNTQLIKQNDKIWLQKKAIEEKNEELEKSKEEILSINEKLQELNNSLEKKVENRTEKIKTTLKKLQLTNKELDTFIYRASHDLKGPISRIYGLTSLAKLESPKTESHKYLELIEKVTYDMQGLLSKLTEVHEVLNRNVTREELDILAILGDIKRSTLQIAANHNISFSFELEPDFILYSDELLIKIILENLIENAFIYRKGSNYPHEVKVKASRNKDALLIVVSDNGIGISTDLVPKIFDMFFRGTEQSKGSGLGLYLVKIAVDKLNGNIVVHSDLGKNSSFTITLPR